MRQFNYCLRLYVLVCFLLIAKNYCFSQNNERFEVKAIDSLIAQQKFKKSDSVLNTTIEKLTKAKNYLNLTKLIYYYGKIQLHLKDEQDAINTVNEFANHITNLTDSLEVSRQKHLVLGRFYVFLKDYPKAKEQNLLALEDTHKMPKATGDLFGLIHHNLSIDYRRMGDIKQATFHSKKSLEYYLSYPKSDKSKVLDAYNSLGARMWDVYKIDSALYYFKKGEAIINKLEPTPMNKFYHKAKTQSNIGSVYSILGDLENAAVYNEKAIKNYDNFIKSKATGKDFFKEEAQLFLLLTIENYAADLTDQGNLVKAKDLLNYVLELKTNAVDRDEMEMAYTSLQLGNTHLRLKDYEVAEGYIDKGLTIYANAKEKNYLGLADAYYYKGLVLDFYGEVEDAKSYYEQSSELYQSIFGSSYDKFYLDAMQTFSGFYSRNGYEEKAIETATKAYNYLVENQGKQTHLEISQALNLATIYYTSKKYNKALEFVNRSLDIINSSVKTADSTYNRLTSSYKKPSALLMKSKIDFALTKDTSQVFLKEQFKNLKQGISLLEQQKTVLFEDKNVSMLIADNDELFELAKKTAIMLFDTTGDTKYLLEALNLHESKVYNKIRQHLNVDSNIRFQDIPNEILDKEDELKKQLNASLQSKGNIEDFIATNNDWNALLNSLKKDFPKYYKLKYASFVKPLELSDLKLNNNTSIVRYLFVDRNLFAFVIDKNSIKLHKINAEKTLSLLNVNDPSTKNYKALYDSLWKPLSKDINTDHVIIIPDAELFNLSFETLSPLDVNTHKELAKTCLLNSYNISYNYSLLLVDQSKSPTFFKDNFIAFTPEFNQQMKTNYVTAIKDSIFLDKTYLTLLPQPFTVDIAEEYSRYFNGNSFINEKASKQIFTQEAKEHKIIHIGTHAESNNISPELSRLIFAKPLETEEHIDNNSLYTYEIYNQNLASNLAILTACETGKPSYQPGEGMISLAHAFNYAGSESILTSLWKIDEQSSAKILEYFYTNIKAGLTKDEALRQAKLSYIAKAKGRTVAPQYWAGLVLIGDASPIDLTSRNYPYWIIGLMLLVIAFIISKRQGWLKL